MYKTNNAVSAYNREKILTASPVELIVMLYDAFIRKLKMTQVYIEDKDYENANINIQKCQDIIVELVNSINAEYEIGRELMKIYDFVNSQLFEINLKKDASKIPPVINIMGELRGSWLEVKKKTAFDVKEGNS